MTEFKNVKRKKPLDKIVKETIIAVTATMIIGGAFVYLHNHNVNRTKKILENYVGIKKITLAQGDTKWEYAKKYCPEGVDIRDYLEFVYEKNNKRSMIDHPGDTIEFPVYVKNETKK